MYPNLCYSTHRPGSAATDATPPQPEAQTMHPLLNIAISAARRAGSAIVRNLNRLDSIKVSSKGRNDFVSEVDRLAEQGMVFSNAYSCAANCAPARACLLSGQYTPRHEIYNVGTRRRGSPKFGRLMHVPGTDTLRT